jgi:hypothetical protein
MKEKQPAREHEKKNERTEVQTKDHTPQGNKKRKKKGPKSIYKTAPGKGQGNKNERIEVQTKDHIWQGPKLKQKITLGKGTRKEKRKDRS